MGREVYVGGIGGGDGRGSLRLANKRRGLPGSLRQAN